MNWSDIIMLSIEIWKRISKIEEDCLLEDHLNRSLGQDSHILLRQSSKTTILYKYISSLKKQMVKYISSPKKQMVTWKYSKKRIFCILWIYGTLFTHDLVHNMTYLNKTSTHCKTAGF